MASQADVQDLLRLLVGRKVPMMAAMGHIKALQAANLKTINDIAEATPKAVSDALKDPKVAKSLHTACKAAVKNPAGSKRSAPGGSSSSSPTAAKRARTMGGDSNDPNAPPPDPREVERQLELPVASQDDEHRMAATALLTNRAPLVLAFAVELLRYTMPEQPPSSRLSLAQAVVSANSRSKAVSLGIETGPSAEEEGWGSGQPRVKIMGREVVVLKRGGYEWTGEEVEREDEGAGAAAEDKPDSTGDGESPEVSEDQQSTQAPAATHPSQTPSATKPVWSVSPALSLKKSTFVARSATLTSPSALRPLLASLYASNPSLRTATHNAWAYRIRPTASSSTAILEESFDDGETGCGAALLSAMRAASAVDCVVVLSRWFGGILLGPDRFRLMRNAASAALSERMRLGPASAQVRGEALWGLDVEALRRGVSTTGGAAGPAGPVVGMPVHRPEAARAYLLRSFATAPAPDDVGTIEKPAEGAGSDETAAAASPTKSRVPAVKKKTVKEMNEEKEENVALLIGTLRLLFDSWADHLSREELDRRAWSWYVAVRPEVESGPAGWGAKGLVKLKDILDLRRKA